MLRRLQQTKNVLALVTVFFVLGGLWWYLSSDACAEPVTYRIGTVDAQFGLSEDDLLRAMFKAEELWEGQAYIDLFDYRPNADIVINFVFDDRQAETIEEQRSSAYLENTRKTVEDNREKYDALKSELDVLRKRYTSEENNYKTRLARYEIEVERSDSSPVIMSQLSSERNEIALAFEKLEEQRRELNQKVEYFNALVGSYEKIINKYNTNVNDYNVNFAGVREFDQGEYTSDGRISIFQYENSDDLVLVLAHEFGHALGLDHVLDPEAIMYFQLSEQNITSPQLRPADLLELQSKCDLVKVM